MSDPSAGWYADPSDATRIRWWDGAAWTGHVRVWPQQPQPAAATQVVAPVAAATTTAVVSQPISEQSIGSALLPPLPKLTSDTVQSESAAIAQLAPKARRRSNGVLLVLISLLAAAAIGGGVYATGVLDQSSEPTSVADQYEALDGRLNREADRLGAQMTDAFATRNLDAARRAAGQFAAKIRKFDVELVNLPFPASMKDDAAALALVDEKLAGFLDLIAQGTPCPDACVAEFAALKAPYREAVATLRKDLGLPPANS